MLAASNRKGDGHGIALTIVALVWRILFSTIATWCSILGQDAGSFLKALYTMFEVTHSGSWPAVVRPVIEKVSPWYDARRRQAYT